MSGLSVSGVMFNFVILIAFCAAQAKMATKEALNATALPAPAIVETEFRKVNDQRDVNVLTYMAWWKDDVSQSGRRVFSYSASKRSGEILWELTIVPLRRGDGQPEPALAAIQTVFPGSVLHSGNPQSVGSRRIILRGAKNRNINGCLVITNVGKGSSEALIPFVKRCFKFR